MLRLEMTDRQMRNLASYPMAYQLGVAYYQAGKVGPLEYNPAERKVKAFVAGTSRYLIQLQLTPEGGLGSYQCSCPAYSNHSGACKHIIAVLKSTQTNLPLIFQKKANSSSTQEFLTFLKIILRTPLRKNSTSRLNLTFLLFRDIGSQQTFP